MKQTIARQTQRCWIVVMLAMSVAAGTLSAEPAAPPEPIHEPAQAGMWAYTPAGQAVVWKRHSRADLETGDEPSLVLTWLPDGRQKSDRLEIREVVHRGERGLGRSSRKKPGMVAIPEIPGIAVASAEQPIDWQWHGRETKVLETRYELTDEVDGKPRRHTWRVLRHPERRWLARPTGPRTAMRGGQHWVDASVVAVEYERWERNRRVHWFSAVLDPEPREVEVMGRPLACHRITTASWFATPRGRFHLWTAHWLHPEVPGLLVREEHRYDNADGRLAHVREVVMFGDLKEMVAARQLPEAFLER